MGKFTRRARRTPKQRQHIPQRADELTSEWLSEVLDTGATVVGVRCEEIGVDVGFIGEVHRCHLTWEPGDSDVDLPPSVIVKVPTQISENFAIGEFAGLYEREIVVYQTLRSTLGVPMPGHFYSAMDPDPTPWLQRPFLFLLQRLPVGGVNWLSTQLMKLSGKGTRRRYVLVIEDIADARPPTQQVGGSLDDARRSLEVLAQFHAANWMRVDALESCPMIFPVDLTPKWFQASYVRGRDQFVEKFGADLSDGMLDRLDAIHERSPDICASLAAEPWTLLHGDFRLDNVLFRPNGDTLVLDFQMLAAGRPAVDVAYFITTALTADHREEEEGLLRTYHDALVAAGESSYSWEQLARDCELAKELIAHRNVGNADAIDTSVDGNSDDVLDVMQLRMLAWLD
jgi:hypothetical protein